ncbi:histidinol-phosphate transaminase [Nocardia australiensis]|uniref:histidinol-phosphate transaminase n=1 Tax=Nocardia australiensis TaxID=2887191 RepID=UPI001D149217|nr:histidinol-phosphate transaminase [Nocardia australiensis]
MGASVTISDLPIRKRLHNQKPYTAPQLTAPVRLNVNESPFPPSQKLIDDISSSVRSALDSLHRYPDREAFALRSELAHYVTAQSGVDVGLENILAANGSLESLQQIMQVFGGPDRSALSFAPSYAMYKIIATTAETEWLDGGRRTDLTLDIDHAVAVISAVRPDIIFLTNPHNPSGQTLATADLERILEAAPAVVVVDEAYSEFSLSPSAINLIDRFPAKLIITRTMSKALAFAGGRLGYVVAAPAVIAAMRLVRLPYHLSTVTQAAALAALRHADDTLSQVSELIRERTRVAVILRDMGFEVIDSDANFFLFGRFADTARSWQHYLDHGVLIRDLGIPHYLRVTVGQVAENNRFLEVSEKLSALATGGTDRGCFHDRTRASSVPIAHTQ